ncbi:MAG: ABC transporter ATP-binding protein [Deltaproteobacteria bacterium]|nr:ABC transporter ATP-binding protein [Deltaproteobacteria bacterium]
MNQQDVIIGLENIDKKFQNTPALRGLDLSIHRNEMVALLGPSGCGKTTTLRIIGGFERPDSGLVSIRGKCVFDKKRFIPPEKRKIGMVFQDIALFPHLSLSENIAFGLKGSKSDKNQRVGEMLELIGLVNQGKKLPHMISGGQQQRVAIARALAPKTEILLLDEPFSSLDFQLRRQLRQDIKKILTQLDVTVILVTHDQYEAFSFAERIVMMHDGQVMQDGSPLECYQNPKNTWVASFVGTANFIPAKIYEERIVTPIGILMNKQRETSGDYQIMIRPEDISILPANKGEEQGIVENSMFLGNREIFFVKLGSGQSIRVQVQTRGNIRLQDPVRLHFEHYKLFKKA